MKNKTILIVDDEVVLLESMAKDLAKEHFSITKALSGEDAIALLRDNEFDLILTDLAMPGIGGIEVLKKAKQKNPLAGVIILTGYGDMASAIDALRLGADDYLLKPCDPDELILRIDSCFKKIEAFQKVKFYEKILPVCIYCKCIRDDTGVEPGNGEWKSMEEYIYQKSDTSISHGCCPECYTKHFK